MTSKRELHIALHHFRQRLGENLLASALGGGMIAGSGLLFLGEMLWQRRGIPPLMLLFVYACLSCPTWMSIAIATGVMQPSILLGRRCPMLPLSSRRRDAIEVLVGIFVGTVVLLAVMGLSIVLHAISPVAFSFPSEPAALLPYLGKTLLVTLTSAPLILGLPALLTRCKGRGPGPEKARRGQALAAEAMHRPYLPPLAQYRRDWLHTLGRVLFFAGVTAVLPACAFIFPQMNDGLPRAPALRMGALLFSLIVAGAGWCFALLGGPHSVGQLAAVPFGRVWDVRDVLPVARHHRLRLSYLTSLTCLLAFSLVLGWLGGTFVVTAMLLPMTLYLALAGPLRQVGWGRIFCLGCLFVFPGVAFFLSTTDLVDVGVFNHVAWALGLGLFWLVALGGMVCLHVRALRRQLPA